MECRDMITETRGDETELTKLIQKKVKYIHEFNMEKIAETLRNGQTVKNNCGRAWHWQTSTVCS